MHLGSMHLERLEALGMRRALDDAAKSAALIGRGL
jgi:hypothetical protein